MISIVGSAMSIQWHVEVQVEAGLIPPPRIPDIRTMVFILIIVAVFRRETCSIMIVPHITHFHIVSLNSSSDSQLEVLRFIRHAKILPTADSRGSGARVGSIIVGSFLSDPDLMVLDDHFERPGTDIKLEPSRPPVHDSANDINN